MNMKSPLARQSAWYFTRGIYFQSYATGSSSESRRWSVLLIRLNSSLQPEGVQMQS